LSETVLTTEVTEEFTEVTKDGGSEEE